MRVIYPEAINQERKALIPYLQYDNNSGWGLKKDVPREIAKRYNILMQKISEFDRKNR